MILFPFRKKSHIMYNNKNVGQKCICLFNHFCIATYMKSVRGLMHIATGGWASINNAIKL